MKYIIRFFLNHIPRKYLQLFAQLATRFISIFYIGNKVECTVCNRHYRKFLPYGYGTPRDNVLCPHCLALERHRLMQLYLKNKTDFYTAKPYVLHVAPEYCFLKRFEKLLGGKYITGDIESPLAKVKMDVHKIPFQDNTFDVIFCNHIMEHVNNDINAMKELYRVLKPGGWGIIQSPINPNREVTYEDASMTEPEERAKHFGQYDHLREYGLDYGNRLESARFTVIEDDYVKTLSQQQINRYALPSGEIIFLVKK